MKSPGLDAAKLCIDLCRERIVHRVGEITAGRTVVHECFLIDREQDLLSVAAGDYDFVGIAEKRAIPSRVIALEIQRYQPCEVSRRS